MTTSIIKTATATDEAPTIAVVVLAFSADPAARWTWPDPNQYLRHFPSFVKAFGGKAFAHGSAHYVDGYTGAALWLPPDVHPDEDTLNTLLQRTASAQVQQDLLTVFEQMGRYHPEEPHWYLPLIGVDPSQQGKDTARRSCSRHLRSAIATMHWPILNPATPEIFRSTYGTDSSCWAPSRRGPRRRFFQCSARRGDETCTPCRGGAGTRCPLPVCACFTRTSCNGALRREWAMPWLTI